MRIKGKLGLKHLLWFWIWFFAIDVAIATVVVLFAWAISTDALNVPLMFATWLR